MTTISDLDFADDICLLENDFNAAQELLSSVIAAAAKTGLIINVKKTQAMFSKHATENLKWGNDVLENVSLFNHMRSTFTDNNDISEEIENRIAKITIKSKRLSNSK